MSSQAPRRSNPKRPTRLGQTKPIRKLSGRAVQTRQTLPASRVIVTVQEDPNSPGLASVQIMRRVARTINQSQQQQPAPPSSLSERLTNQVVDLISSLFSSQTPSQRLELARQEQMKLQEATEAGEETEAK